MAAMSVLKLPTTAKSQSSSLYTLQQSPISPKLRRIPSTKALPLGRLLQPTNAVSNHHRLSPCHSSTPGTLKTPGFTSSSSSYNTNNNTSLLFPKRDLSSLCSSCLVFDNESGTSEGSEFEEKWDPPDVKIMLPTVFACQSSYYFAKELTKAAAPYLGLQVGVSLELLLLNQIIEMALGLGFLYSLSKYKLLSQDFIRFDWREIFNLQWLCFAGLFLLFIIADVVLRASDLHDIYEIPHKMCYPLVVWLPFTTPSTVREIGAAIVFCDPVVTENVIRSFIMMQLTKWFPIPISVFISAGVYAFKHPWKFSTANRFGGLLGISFFRSRNLLTPITIHAVWKIILILPLIFLKNRGCNFMELARACKFSLHISVYISAGLFALQCPWKFMKAFILGTMLGFSSVVSRNILAPIIIHAIWNILLISGLIFLKSQGYNVMELARAMDW